MCTDQSRAKQELVKGFQTIRAGHDSHILQTGKQAEVLFDFANSVASGLARNPRQLECRFLYDTRGSELYEQITCQPEYYPTRTEATILARHVEEIRQLTGPVSIIELGSGSSAKTVHLLRAWTVAAATPAEVCYIPVDVSASALQVASRSLRRNYPGIRVIGVNSTYQEAFALFADAAPAMIVFLGSTIGNLERAEASRFFQDIARHMAPDEYFLLGVDLVKDAAVLEAAYNDAAGVTAAFTCNLFARMNRELDSCLDLDGIEHVARWNQQDRQIEIHARFRRPQTLRVGPLCRDFRIDDGEEILVEISRKFRLAEIRAELTGYGLQTCRTFTDPRSWYALLLLQKTSPGLRRLQ